MRPNLMILKTTGLHASAVLAKSHKAAKQAADYATEFASDLEAFMSVENKDGQIHVKGRKGELLAVVNFS